jgi:hypothetical protein
VSNELNVTDTVALYSTLIGFIGFTSSKLFEVSSETHIFSTFATNLHNCDALLSRADASADVEASR